MRGLADPLTQGSLMLAEEGCGMFVRLVVNGPRAGEIWRIDPDWGGFVPAHPNFRVWYTHWLERPWPPARGAAPGGSP
ncbi:hypothetical protein ACF06X_27600 [Streptomyces sp. NPDC015346]|uniref:hypothetical protein n=1 Tax=Streptomyces sp. NPDC015346 TaxID=3364954 RepID=UPI0036FBFFF7